jgi:hypothetical protein
MGYKLLLYHHRFFSSSTLSGHSAHLHPNDNPLRDCNHDDFDFQKVGPHEPSPEDYQAKLSLVINSSYQNDYEKNHKATGISKPSILSMLKYMLLVPQCLMVDLMHLFCLNVGELLIPLWQGSLKCHNQTDSVASWDWAKLTGPTWEEHGQLVAAAT